jgi:MFS family permease
MRHMLRAFRYRNYRLFFGGQSISLIGTWMQTIAMSWLIYQISHSTALLGVVALVSQVPAFIVSPIAGVWLDQLDRRKILVATQSLACIQAFILAALVFTNQIAVWHILVLSVGLGLVSAFDIPGRQAFLIQMVENHEDLGNAIALNSSQFNIARLIGPAVAGVLIKLVGEATCFLLNGISYIFVIGALLLIKVPPHTKKVQQQNLFANIAEGWRYTSSFVPIRALLLLLALISLCSGMYSVLMPAFATKVFHGDASTLGYLYGAVGVGALAGAIQLAARRAVVGLGTLAFISALVFGVSMGLFGVVHTFALSLAVLVGVGYGTMVNMAATNTLLQSLLEEHMRGRVMAFYTMAFMGAMPLGSFVGGYLADAVGLAETAILSGSLAIVGAFVFFIKLPDIRAEARPVLQRKGVIPNPEKAGAAGQ